MADPLVSVVMPTHDRPEWLSEALGSVLSGKFEDIEVIVSNNGDPRHTRELAESVTDPRVRWVEHTRDSGLYEHWMFALAQARGKYVAALCDDDSWSSRFLSELVPALEARDDAVLAFVDHYIVDGNGAIDSRATEACSRRFHRDRMNQGYLKPFYGAVAHQSIAISGCVYRRSALKLDDLTPEIELFLDIWLFYLLAQSGGSAYYHDERLLNYRVHEASSTASRHLSAYLGAIYGRSEMLRDPRMRQFCGVLRSRLAGDHRSAGAVLLRQYERRAARKHLLRSVCLRPTVKAVGCLVASWIAPVSMIDRVL